MPRNLDTAVLRTFVAVAEAASMTVAADQLHLTQGAVSQQIARLEQAIGCRVFLRERRGLRLSRPGERMFARAKALLGLHDEMLSELGALGPAGAVRLGVPSDLVGPRLAAMLKAYAKAFPSVELALACATSPELAEAVGAGRVDLALIEAEGEAGTGERLSIEPLVWVGARLGSAHGKRPLPVSLVAATCAFRPAVLAALGRHDIAWRMMFESGSLEATTAIVRADLAVTAWLAAAVPDDLRILPPGAGLPALPCFAICLHIARQAKAQPAVAALAEYVRTAYAGTLDRS